MSLEGTIVNGAIQLDVNPDLLEGRRVGAVHGLQSRVRPRAEACRNSWWRRLMRRGESRMRSDHCLELFHWYLGSVPREILVCRLPLTNHVLHPLSVGEFASSWKTSKSGTSNRIRRRLCPTISTSRTCERRLRRPAPFERGQHARFLRSLQSRTVCRSYLGSEV